MRRKPLRTLLGRTWPVAIIAAASLAYGAHLITPGAPSGSLHVTIGRSKLLTACSSNDCGPYQATLSWVINQTGTTVYRTYLNGTQVGTASSSPFTFTGMDCGTTFTLGVRPYNGNTALGSGIITTSFTTPACPEFPLQVSGNGRYLETAGGKPFLIVGDSPQSVIGNLSEANADSYFSDRETNGFNALWINLLCEGYTSCNDSGKNLDGSGVAPFTSGSGPASYLFGSGQCGDCNSTYFTDAYDIISDAQTDGIEVFLDPIPTDACGDSGVSWMSMMTNASNGDGTISTSDGDYRYGQYLGTEFGGLKNIVWTSGNDFQCIETSADQNDAVSVANGIANTDPTALQTLEPDYCIGGGYSCEGSSSLDDTNGSATGWSSRATLNLTYTYAPAYAEDRLAYGQSPTMPMFLGESNYDSQQNSNTDGCGPGAAGDTTSRNCRLQEWWTMTSGATGQLYGGPCYGITNSTTLADCDDTAVTELGYVTKAMDNLDWWNLAPDTGHTVVTSGYGTCPTTGSIVSVTCVTTASDYSGSAGSATESVSYLPDPSSLATITVNMADFNGSVTAQWFDPTNGSYATVSGSPFTNSGTHNFTPTGNNNAGNKDWVLVLTS